MENFHVVIWAGNYAVLRDPSLYPCRVIRTFDNEDAAVDYMTDSAARDEKRYEDRVAAKMNRARDWADINFGRGTAEYEAHLDRLCERYYGRTCR